MVAAELEELIERYRQHGLVSAAEALSALKVGLHATGQLPARLGSSPSPSPASAEPVVGGGETTATEQARATPPALAEWTHSEEAVYRGIGGIYQIDRLGLSRRVRHTLVRNGVWTVAQVEALADNHELRRIRNIGPKSTLEITDRLRRYVSQRPSES